jgi:hypothetical protein
MSMRGKIDRAAERSEEEKANLYREDGTKRYSDEEHREREAEINRRFRAEMDALEEDVKREVADAEEALLVAEHSDPSDALTTEELGRANARRRFVSDEVYTVSTDELVKRCRAILAQGDRPSMFLHAHFAGQVVDDINDLEKREEVCEVISALRSKLDAAGER